MGLTAAQLAAATAAAQILAPTPKSASSEPQLVAGFTQDERTAYLSAYNAVPDTVGSGPYPALMESDPALPNHTIYRPVDLRGVGRRKLGVLIWGNGGCSDDGASARLQLAEIASHGYIAVAPGIIRSGPSYRWPLDYNRFLRTTPDDLRVALNWILAENSRKGSRYYRRIDPQAVAVGGHSCGGMQAILVAPDPRIKTIIIQNSGILPNKPERPQYVMDRGMLDALSIPILYLVGNASDIAFEPSQEDFDHIRHVPVVRASNTDADHHGTFAQPNGGAAARAAVDWLEWQLREDREASLTFSGPDCRLCTDPTWAVQRKGIR